MQKRGDSMMPLVKRPFDLQEAVILLDVYLSMVKNGKPITKAAEMASVDLRNLARSKGFIISDSYRSAVGLTNRLRSIGNLYENKESKSVPGTAKFIEAVSLYRNNRVRYEEILNTVKRKVSQRGQNGGMPFDIPSEEMERKTDGKKSKAERAHPTKREFFQWLPTVTSLSVLKSIQKSYSQINVLLIKSKALSQSLTSVTSTDEVEFALRCTKKTLANKHLRNTAIQLLEAYAAYLRGEDKLHDRSRELQIPDEPEPIQVEHCTRNAASVRSVSVQESKNVDPEQIEKVEKIVLDADMSGVTYDSLCNTLGLTMAATKALARQCKWIVEIKGKLYHEDAFIDWNDGAKQICLIIEKLMQKNHGYISAAQLYDYARAEMNMFLNDNDMNDERAVYEIAEHLFEKNSFEGYHYLFTGKAHISRPEDAISSNFDVICKFAEDRGGVFGENDLTEYLIGIGIKAGNLRNQMRLGKEPEFFFYEPGTIISAKSMGIDDAWKESVGRALSNLLSDADDHIVLRQIQPVWYESLPALPEHRRWTPLLLQYVLRFYGKEFGAKTIMAMKSQNMDTLHAMLVKPDSLIQNFGDAVITYLVESEMEQRSFAAEELRQLLVKTGMIQGNELIGNMPKALAKDERFAWDAKGENVTVRV